METQTKSKELTDYEVVGICEGFIDHESREQYLQCWQILSDRELWKGLQGFFYRNMKYLIEQGLIKPKTT